MIFGSERVCEQAEENHPKLVTYHLSLVTVLVASHYLKIMI